MSWYTVQPHDPLLVRDGRPFELDSGGARSLDFPPPSVTAGMVRSRIGLHRGDGRFSLSPTEAQAISVTGPLLARLSPGDPSLLLPAPRDCVIFPKCRRHRLHPGERWPGCSLPDGLRPVVPVQPLPKEKPHHKAGWWAASTLQKWLSTPCASHDQLQDEDVRESLLHERRVHVAIDPETGTGEDGKLFETDGLRFERPGTGGVEQLALVLRCSDPDLREGLATLGGERRLSALRRAGWDPRWAAPALGENRARVVLLTPALFREGAVPKMIGGAKVVAAAVGRAEPLSGWDLAAGGAKASRRMAPAGSVYWVELGKETEAAWVEKVHWQAISDDEQDRRDGFGLAAVGVWP